MSETTLNESTEQRITTNSGGDRVFSGPDVVAHFAFKASGYIGALLAVISQSKAEACFIEDAMEAAQDLAWQVQQAAEILVDSTAARPPSLGLGPVSGASRLHQQGDSK